MLTNMEVRIERQWRRFPQVRGPWGSLGMGGVICYYHGSSCTSNTCHLFRIIIFSIQWKLFSSGANKYDSRKHICSYTLSSWWKANKETLFWPLQLDLFKKTKRTDLLVNKIHFQTDFTPKSYKVQVDWQIHIFKR